MRVKKIKILFSLIIFMFTAGLFCACGGVNGSVKFKQSTLEMYLNQEVDLSKLVELDGCGLSDITFVSSNPDIVYVRANGKLVSRSEGVSVISAKGYDDAILEITVNGTNLQFGTPTNLSYDETKNAVVWDPVYAGEAVATTYNVKITKDGGNEFVTQINTNSYQVLDAGTYSIKVSCAERTDVGILASEESELYTFSKLNAPRDLVYNDSTGILTWNADESITSFRVMVNGVSSEVISTKQYSLNLKEPKKYEISVMACANDNDANVFGATSIDSLSLTRLKAPTISISNGTITWTDAEQGAGAFDLTITGATTIKEKILKNSAGQYSYTLSGKDPGEYAIEMVAMGDSADLIYNSTEKYLNSEKSNLNGVVKLEKQQLSFDKANKTIKVVDFDADKGYKLMLTVKHDGTLKEVVDISATGQYTSEFSDSGLYEFVLSNISDSNLQINGDDSDAIRVVRLAKATNASHKIVEDKYYVENYDIADASKYVIEILQKTGGENRFELTSENNSVAELFGVAGEYVVNIYASGTDTANTYYLDSVTNTKLSVLRLDVVTPVNDESNKAIVWNDVASLGNLRYAYELTGEVTDSNLLEDNRYSYAGLGVGSYTLNVWATTNRVDGEQTIILDSLKKSSIDFSIYKTISAPSLDWEKETTDSGIKYSLKIANVEGALSYMVYANGDAVGEVFATSDEYVSFDATSCFAQMGTGANGNEYIIEVQAQNKENIYYYDSDKSSVKVIRANAPTTFDFGVINSEASVKETLSASITANWYSGTEILINGVACTDLTDERISDADIFNIKVKYLANDSNVSGAYYIDSDYAEFTITKVSTKLYVNGQILTWETSETTQEIINRLIITQGDHTDVIELTEQKEFDLTSLNSQKFDLNANVQVSFQTIIKAFTGSIAGEYVDGKFVSGDLVSQQRVLSNYYSSSNLNTINVKYAGNDVAIVVAEESGLVNITWAQRDGAIYKLNGETNYSFASSSFEPSVKRTLSLEEIIDETRNVYIFTITRLDNVETISVDKEENISAINMPERAQELICELNGTKANNLSGINSSLGSIVSAYYKAGDNNAQNYFLNSNVTNFVFKRLQNLNTTSNLNIFNNIISWNREESPAGNTYKYLVTFYDENGTGVEYPVELDLETTNSIDLAEDKYSNIIYSLQGNKFVKVQKIVGAFEASSTKDNYLTSGSSSVELKILNAPTAVKITANENDITQTDIQITWNIDVSGGYTPAKYNIKIYSKNSENTITAVGYYTVTNTDLFFKESGDWFVEVQAVGEQDVISSKYSSVAKINRLEPSRNLSVSSGGLIEWGEVENASGYKLVYTYTKKDGSIVTINKEFDTSVVSYQMPQEELNTLFDGSISANIYAVGTGASSSTSDSIGYLSSVKSELFKRVVAPDITLTGTQIIFNNYDSYVDGELVFVTATIGGKQVLNLQVTPIQSNSQYIWNYPTSYSYYDGDQLVEVEFETSKDIVFSVYARNVKPNCIDSNMVTKSATILANITDLKFARDASGVVHFYATNPNTAINSTQVIVGEQKYIYNGNVDFSITEEILEKLGLSWTISVKALGQGGNVVYIQSKVSSISGTKLANNVSITTNSTNTKVIWSEVAGATNYILKYYNLDDSNNKTEKTGYVTSREELIGTNYEAGIYKFSVKSIGNVTTGYVSENVILDATYSVEQEITKLETIPNIALHNGFFGFGEVNLANAYVAVLYSDLASAPIGEYALVPYVLPTGEADNYYYSFDLINAIADNGEYYLQFYAKSTTTNYISSDMSDIVGTNGTENYIIVSTFASSDNYITLSHPNIDENNVNYAVTYATFNMNKNVNNGIFLSINGDIQFTTENVHILDPDGTWDSGRHILQYAQLGSSSVGADRKVYLTTFGQETRVTKLAETRVALVALDQTVQELGIAFALINNADAYYCYIGDEGSNNLYKIHDKNSNLLDLSDLAPGEYKTVSVRPISKNLNILAGNRVYLKETENKENNLTIVKQAAPTTLMTEDGSLNWQLTKEDAVRMYTSEVATIQKPFLTTSKILELQYIKLRFTNKVTGQVSEFIDNAYKYIYITDEVIAYMEGLGHNEIATSLKDAQVKGFPYINYGFLDFANILSGGEYEIQAKLIGNLILEEVETGKVFVTLSSEYNESVTKYIANAPIIRVENNNDIYNLKFTNVTVNTSYFTNSSAGLPTYDLIGIYTGEDGNDVREVITSVKATGVNNSEEIVLSLTSLVENGKLTSKYKAIYVNIKGNDATGVLNSKCSNQISIVILEEIKAKVKHGVIQWTAQDYATKYIVTYNTNRIEFKFEEGKSIYSWDCADLAENAEYEISIMAYGSQGRNASDGGVVVISGANTNLGTIKKLQGITAEANAIDVTKGIYKWPAIANATAYDVFIVKAQITDGNYGTYITIPDSNFETTADNLENYYYFRAVGTEEETLTENSYVYVNSNISAYNRGLRCVTVSELQFENGILSWKYTNTNASFRIIFNRAENGNLEEDIIVYTSYTDCVKNGICYLDTNNIEALRNHGDYIVDVQAFFNDKTETNTNTGVYYVISKAQTLDFHKLQTVTDIKVQEGVISWEYEGRTNLDYHFRLEFSYYDEANEKTVQTVKYVAGGTNSYEGIIFENDVSKYPITLVMYVVPGAISVDTYIQYALSIPYTYQNELYQFDRVSEDTISISITENGQLLIDWYGPDDESGDTSSYKYEVCYYTDRDGEERFIATVNSHVLCGDGQDISFNIDDEYSLYIKIRIIPIADNYISSAWTEPRQIEKPTKVTGLTYNEERFEFTWDTYETGDELGSSFYYKVKDEIGHYEDVNGEETFIVDTVYIFNANIGDEIFTPFVIGTHRVSVAVIIKNSASTGLMSDYCDPIVAEINMFESGIGTEENPYIISTEEHFGNLRYRLLKDTKNNAYYDSKFVDGKLVVDETLTTMNSNNTVYHFKQIANIAVTKANAIVNYPDAEGNISLDDLEFNGSYNGDYHSITLVWNENIENNSSISHITLFEKIGVRGVLSNINVLLNIDTTININKTMILSALTYENSGTIQNIVVGKNDKLTEIAFTNLRREFTLSFITNGNNGTIQNVENFYDVRLKTVNNDAVAYASIAINNNSQSNIISAKNYGNINIDATAAYVGGIVQYMDNNSNLEQSANVGDIHVFLSSTNSSLIGGLVGKVYKAKVSYCYVIGDITIASSTTPSAYVGGLIGHSEGDNITYCYTNVTKNKNLIEGFTPYSGVYQVVGYLTSVNGDSRNVYYKEQTDFSAVNTTGNISSSILSYIDTALNAGGLFETDSKFTSDVLYQGNPTLLWEATFEKLEWK